MSGIIEKSPGKAGVKAWADALRLRTLPLSSAGTVMAAGLAVRAGAFRWDVFLLMFFTANLLQILSNMANDYGDYVKGTDGESRIGPRRALASGKISREAFWRGGFVVCGLTMITGLALVLSAFGLKGLGWAVVFLLLGAASIVAAIKYTVGRGAYGYRGLGEVFVLVFFGWVAVTGGLFLYTGRFDTMSLLPATAVGLMSAGVLNLNNIRDAEGDRACGKHTLASRMSLGAGKVLQCMLLLGAMVAVVLFWARIQAISDPLWLFPVAVCLVNIPLTAAVRRRKDADKLLKILSITTLVLSIVLSTAINV